MDSQLSFQECREAFAARHGRFVDICEDEDTTATGSVSSLSTNPTAAVPPRVHSVPPTIVWAAYSSTIPTEHGVPSTIVGAASSSTDFTEAVPPRARGVPSISTAVSAASSSTDPTADIPPRAHGVPPTIVGAASSYANPVNPPTQKAKALPGPKTYENDAHISLLLSIANQSTTLENRITLRENVGLYMTIK